MARGSGKSAPHKASKRRTWRKLHLGIDEASGEILAAVASTNNLSDGDALPDILNGIDQGGVRSQEMRSQNDERVAGGNIPPAISHKIAPEEETYWVTNRSQQLLTAASSGKACERQIFEGVALALRGGSESPTKPTLLTPDSWLLAPVQGEIEQVSADGAYDQRKCYDAIHRRQAKATIPPRKGAKIWRHGNSKQERHNRLGESAPHP